MIFPLRVLGSALVNRISSGCANAPISLRTCCFNSFRNSSVGSASLIVTKTATASPLSSCGRPTAAASATAAQGRQTGTGRTGLTPDQPRAPERGT